MKESLFQDMLSSMRRFFHNGFLNTKGPLKTLTEISLLCFLLSVASITVFSNDNNLDQELELTNSPEIIEEQDRTNSFKRVDDFNEDDTTNKSIGNSPTLDDIDPTETIVRTP